MLIQEPIQTMLLIVIGLIILYVAVRILIELIGVIVIMIVSIVLGIKWLLSYFFDID